MEQSNLNVGWMDWDWDWMGYLQTGPFLDHLAVIKNKERYWFPAGLIKTVAKSSRKLIITCVIAPEWACHDYIIVGTSMNKFFCFSKVT